MELVGQKTTDLNTARTILGGAGTQTSALAFGGFDTSNNSNRRMDRCRSSSNSYFHRQLSLVISFK
jgi:uncharacterized protein (DUF1501 family)